MRYPSDARRGWQARVLAALNGARTARLIRRPDAFALFVAGVAALASASVLLRAASFGPLLFWDSMNYIGVARSLLAGGGFAEVYRDGGLYTHWPPLYPALLAAGGLSLFDPLDMAVPLNAAAFGVTVFAVGAWLRKRLRSRFLAVWGCAAVAVAAPLSEMAAYALSETVFMMFVALALIRTDDFLERGGRASLIWAALFAALACLTRWMGFALIASVAAALLFRRSAGRGERVADAAAFSVVSALPVCAWMLRNYALSGYPTGRRTPVDYQAGELVGELLARVGGWAARAFADGGGAATVAGAAILLASALAIGMALARGGGGRRSVIVFGAFSAAHLAALLASQIALGNVAHGIQWRFVLPLYIPLTLATLAALDALLSRARLASAGDSQAPRSPRWALRASFAVAAAMSLWLAQSAIWSAGDIYRQNADGHLGSHELPIWRDSEVLRHLRDNPAGGHVFANEGLLVYVNVWQEGDGAKYRYLPALSLGALASSDLQSELDAAFKNIDGEIRAVWLDNYYRNSDLEYGPGDLRTLSGLEPIAGFRDGTIFRRNTGYIPPDPRRGRLLADAGFDVYLDGDALVYVREPCEVGDARGHFSLVISPARVGELPDRRARNGIDRRGFFFYQRGAEHGGKCVAWVNLPKYEMRVIETGQRDEDGGDMWKALIELPPSAATVDFYRADYESVSSGGEPLARAEYDVYLDGGDLVYLKRPCADEHAGGRFLLSVFPKDVGDLPEERREAGHEGHNFDFVRYGVRFDDRCMIRRPLPGYAVESVEIGRWIPGGREVWRATAGIGE